MARRMMNSCRTLPVPRARLLNKSIFSYLPSDTPTSDSTPITQLHKRSGATSGSPLSFQASVHSFTNHSAICENSLRL